MRYGSIAIALLCLFSTNSFANLKVITPSEEATLKEIEQQYNIDSQLITVNDKFSQLNKRYYDLQELKDSITANQVAYDDLIAQLPNKILAKTNMAQFYSQIEANINSTANLTQKTKIDAAAIERQRVIVQQEYEIVEEQRLDRSQQLFKLKTDIINRLLADLSKSSSKLKVDLDGSTQCSKFQSISDCLKKSKSEILSSTRSESPFLNDKSVLLSYEVTDASMNMTGDLRYKVAMNFKPSYNSKIDTVINEKLGLRSAMITLVSNVAADWYINGVKVGTGTKIFHEVPLGKHGILASYQNSDKSSIEKIEGNGVFSYKFEHVKANKQLVSKNNSVELLPPALPVKTQAKTKTTANSSETKKPKAKFTLLADNTTIPTPSKATKNKADKEQAYEYFIGIPATTNQQNAEFSTEQLRQ
ncbi:hypothetical protein [Shewanella pneumatophori]|uniref:PEGA domain-containing protein n=1 Tax=Shewanella pneumatophori TaxID=314092 RepID=A0A9X2CJ54_9GAMM|nr:hypothetical protein [Shewanella pneumatophori]MCL1140149.1 hypothetical protein [Shewanella pneumatophori]